MKRYGVWSVSKLSPESVGSRRELVANCVHTADADATQIDSFDKMNFDQYWNAKAKPNLHHVYFKSP